MLRRRLLAGLPLSTLTMVGAQAATGDLAVTCDTTLAPVLRKAGARYEALTGVRVHVFATPPGLIVPQLVRDIQNDIVVTQTTILDQAVQAGVVATLPRAQWRNPIVIAGRRGATIISGSFAAADASPASDMDTATVLSRIGIMTGQVQGALDTDEVAFLLRTGAAQAGLLHMTDVRAHDALSVIRPVPPDIQPALRYAASVSRLAQRPDPQGFVRFLASSDGGDVLTEGGLEITA
ncbi:MAG: substrate-binding domain-containing protein [Acetobacteraceae bacterium]